MKAIATKRNKYNKHARDMSPEEQVTQVRTIIKEFICEGKSIRTDNGSVTKELDQRIKRSLGLDRVSHFYAWILHTYKSLLRLNITHLIISVEILVAVPRQIANHD